MWNGEDKSDGLWTRCSPEIVDNPLQEGINTSKKCVKFTINKGNFEKESIVLDLKKICGETGLNMKDSKRLSIMVKKSIANNIKVELSAGAETYWKHIASWYDGNGKWQKLVFDFTNNCDFGDKYPTELAIYPLIDEGQPTTQEIFVDNIVLEDNPTVNGKSLWQDVADGSLDGKLELTGSYFKTKCMNTDVNPWKEYSIDDFAALNNKLSANVTSIDMRKASTLGVDINKFFEDKNPNTIVYANENYEHANVVVVGADGTGTANSLELTDANAFNAPYGFKAESVKLTRDVREDINSFVLPFAAKATELGADKVAIYKDCTLGDVANFETAESVVANTPFLTTGAKEASELNFTNKDIVATPESLGTDFVGVYAPQTAEGKYGIDDKGLLHKGGAGATIAAFHAYLVPNVARVAFNGSTPTAINGVAADKTVNTAVYDLSGRRVYGKLSKGLYIMNGKKVVVK